MAKFGDDAKLLIAMETQAPIAKKMAEGDVEQNAMIATIRSKDGKDTLQLKNVDGQWKVDIGALIRGQDISQVVPMFRAVGKAAQQVADEIDSGKCKTVAEARAAMGQRMESARKEEVRLLMESATKPSAAESSGAAGK
jgi:hypothetical protein